MIILSPENILVHRINQFYVKSNQQTVICTTNVEYLPILMKPSSVKNGLACQWLGNDICMQNVIKIYYVVKSNEHFHELLTDGRADELK